MKYLESFFLDEVRTICHLKKYDGYVQVSKNLMQQIRPGQGVTPSDTLMKIFQEHVLDFNSPITELVVVYLRLRSRTIVNI